MVEPHAPDHLKQVVEDGLGSYHVAVTGFAEYYPVAIFLKDAHDAVLGGVLGHIWGKWLRTAILWLAEPVRGQGYGRQLLLAGEAYTRERGCEQVQLSTFSFQARPFYEKLGYDDFATLEDCPPGTGNAFCASRSLKATRHPHKRRETAEQIACMMAGPREGMIARLARCHGGLTRETISPVDAEERIR